MRRYWIFSLIILLAVLIGVMLISATFPPADSLFKPTTVQTDTPSDPTQPETTIPDVTQPPVCLPEPADSEFVRVLDYIPGAKVFLPYATTDNFTGQRIYDFSDAYLRYGTVKKLMAVSEELKKLGIGLLIWDAFRPVAAQAKLWEICPDPTYVSNPKTGRRTHCRGNTVDISLYDLRTGAELTMPTGFDNFTKLADRDYSDCSPEAAANARLLEETMQKHGFKPYFGEWWHFEDVTDYPIDDYFYPSIPTLWVPNCVSFIGFRNTSEVVIKQIPVGESMTLLGWKKSYAKVSYKGQIGYVASNYVMPADEDYFLESLSSVAPTNMYSYAQMMLDIGEFEVEYPDILSVSTIGSSELGRAIPVICIGNPDAEYQVLLLGAVHGREHMTAWLLMAIADYWLQNDLLSYGDVCYHVIPMVNPDGVTISQTGCLSEEQEKIYLRDKKVGYTWESKIDYATQWKANGLGVDINRNFPSGWKRITTRRSPSSEKYRGTEPFSSAEAKALRDYTLSYPFDATISYHSSGNLIYHSYGNKKDVNKLSKSLANAVKEISGYPLDDGGSVAGAGYKDWAIDELKIPSITVEIGCGVSPLAERELYSIFIRNFRILPSVARWLQMQ